MIKVSRSRKGGTTATCVLPGDVHDGPVSGVGAVKVKDTVWRAVSDETLEAGQPVEVSAVDGSTLRVRRV